MGKSRFEIKYSPLYIDDLTQILNYITNVLNNPTAAEKLLNKVNEAIGRRSFNPLSFEKYNRTKESKYNWYKIRINNFTVFYIVIDNTMFVEHILSSRRYFKRYI